MNVFARTLTAIDSHTECEPTRLVTGGLPHVPGGTMREKRDWLARHHDDVRTALVLEPRGHDAIVLAYLLPPCEPGADAGVVFANDAGYLGMCGHGAIGVATTLVACGTLGAREPETPVVLDTPAGVVRARVQVRDGRPRSVKLVNVPAFAQELDRILPVEGIGKVRCDVAWGGNWFAFVRAEDVGLEVGPQHLDRLLDIATRVRSALAGQGVAGRDPRTGASAPIDHVKLWADAGPRAARAFTLCPGRAYDRSPCGTGTSAKLAVLHARGELAPGESFESQSVLGTRFAARILEVTRVAGAEAVVVELEGSAWLTAFAQFVLDPHDPLRLGLMR